jgi:hypothetical protein
VATQFVASRVIFSSIELVFYVRSFHNFSHEPELGQLLERRFFFLIFNFVSFYGAFNSTYYIVLNGETIAVI